METLFITLTTLIAGTACLSRETTADQRAVQAEQPLVAPAATASADELCRPFMQRQRACSTTFIPALVEARVTHDNPPGIRAREKEVGRPALLEEAFDEWAVRLSLGRASSARRCPAPRGSARLHAAS